MVDNKELLEKFCWFIANYESDILSPEAILIWRKKGDITNDNWKFESELIEEFLKDYKG